MQIKSSLASKEQKELEEIRVWKRHDVSFQNTKVFIGKIYFQEITCFGQNMNYCWRGSTNNIW